MQLNTAIFKNKYVVAALIAIAVAGIWYGLKQYKAEKDMEALMLAFGVSSQQIEDAGKSDSTLVSPDQVAQSAWYGWDESKPIPQ